MTQQKPFPWLKVILGVGCVGILCVGVLVVGGGAFFLLTQRSVSPSVPESAVTLVVELPIDMTEAPQPAPSPAPAPTDSGPTLTGNQHLDDHSLYDDFSSESLYWPVYDDGKTIIKYENQAYSIQITKPDYYDFAFFPVDFIPYEMWFDVQGLPGSQDGTFGVFCHFQDSANYYFVEIDLETNEYLIGQILDDETIPLTKQNADGNNWSKASVLKSPPTSVNRIGFSCHLDNITLFINDQLVDEVSVSQPFDQPGEAAFFVYAFDFAGPNGYKVFFDNVETYQPMQ